MVPHPTPLAFEVVAWKSSPVGVVEQRHLLKAHLGRLIDAQVAITRVCTVFFYRRLLRFL